MHLDIDRKRLYAILLTVFVFLSIIVGLLLGLYAIGNFQGFLDATQLFLISLLSILIVVHMVTGVLLLVATLLQDFETLEKRRRAVAVGVFVIFSFILFLGIRALMILIFF